MIDRPLGDRYRLERRIGIGGMATVYQGVDTVLRRRVAVKVLRADLAADADFVDRFYTEAQHAAKLSHPNVVNVFDVGREGDAYYIVMEYVDGATLAEMMGEDRRVPESVAIDFAAQIASGLAYAHRQNVLHRDIKPQNVLVTRDDVAKISDFGIARAMTAHTIVTTQRGMVMGSVYYISPEQAQGLDLDQSSDLYSLGVVLFQMLTGRLPYEGDTPVAIALKHVSSPVPPLEAGGAPVASPALAAIVLRLLAKDPRDRYGSATAVATALRAARERPGDVPSRPDSGTAAVPRATPREVVPPPPKPRPSRFPDKPDLDKTDAIPVVGPDVVDIDDAEQESSAPSRGPLVALALLLLLLVAGALGYGVTSGRLAGIFHPTPPIELESFVGKSYADATKELTAQGLQVHEVDVASETIPQDRVVAQVPEALATVPAGSVVELDVSTGYPFVDLPSLVTFSRTDAERFLKNAKLTAKIETKFSAAPSGSVIAQRPAPGRLRMRTAVTLVVSQGVAPVAVPEVTEQAEKDATAALTARGFVVNVQRQGSEQVAAGVVLSQNPAGGATAAPKSTVDLVVSSGPALVTVPDVRGTSLGGALDRLAAAGFTTTVTYVQTGDGDGRVLDQSPAPPTGLRKGAAIALDVAVAGVVPDVSGQTVDRATQTLRDNGYGIGNRDYAQEGSEGTIVRTDPPAGSELRAGETVNVTISGVGP